ncbi:MAG: glutaredoxin family protein [Natronomonas sp.]
MSFEIDEGLPQEEVDELVDEVIENNEVVLFMKGTAMAPQCGYSEKALHHVRRYREDVECIDVLTSIDEFRAALERHSGWTTTPQAYVDGEFVGGSDVLEELDERGELAATLNAE